MSNCNKIQIIFLISNLILKRDVTIGNVVKIDKIKEYCNSCSIQEIEEILNCFIENKLLTRVDMYACYNEHTFKPNSQDFDNGYECLECLEISEIANYFIEPEELSNRLISSTYRLNTTEKPEVWQANTYAMMGEYTKAASLILPLIKAELSAEENKDSLIPKVAPYFTIAGSTTVVGNSIVPALLALL